MLAPSTSAARLRANASTSADCVEPVDRLVDVSDLRLEEVGADHQALAVDALRRFGLSLNSPRPVWTTSPSAFFASPYRTV